MAARPVIGPEPSLNDRPLGARGLTRAIRRAALLFRTLVHFVRTLAHDVIEKKRRPEPSVDFTQCT